MGRLYTLDEKLLCGSPEIRIGERIYPVDDRTSTVMKALSLFERGGSEGSDTDRYGELFSLAFGENAGEIAEMDMPFAAYRRLAEAVIALMTGGEPEDKSSFPGE